MPQLSRPALPAGAALPPRAALLLDLDGTLIDFAPTPDAVVVPESLRASLRALRVRLDDALAVVSGRPVAQIDALLGDLPYAVAGEHGGAIRHAPGAALERPDLPELPEAWLADAEAAVAAWPGALVERKAQGLVLHFRQAPAAAGALHDVARRLVGGNRRFEVLPGAMVWEIRPHGADKGSAVRALMTRPPFAGRVPVYIGDDRTDEDGIRAACALGGVGWLVAETFCDAAGVRAWLAAVAADGVVAG